MARKIEAYVDTSALIAFVDLSDSYHSLFRRLFSDPPPLATSSLVVAEGHAWFLKRYDGTRALQFLSLIETMDFLAVLSVGTQEFKPASALLRRYADQGLTLADAVGLHLLKALRLRSCWSTDRHLGLTGVPLVIHERARH
jgi:predicted nucleic acid-binding protein